MIHQDQPVKQRPPVGQHISLVLVLMLCRSILGAQVDDVVRVTSEIVHTHLHIIVGCPGSVQVAVQTVLSVLQHMVRDHRVLH